MQDRGGIILALVFILFLIIIGTYFMQQVYLEENSRSVNISGYEESSEIIEVNL